MSKAKIALVSSHGLGDGLLALVLSQNLAKNGYQVTQFNDYIAGLVALTPDIQAERHPREVLSNSDYELVLFDEGSNYAKQVLKGDPGEFSSNHVSFRASRTQPRWPVSGSVKERIGDHKKLQTLLAFNRSLKQKGKHHTLIPEHYVTFLRELGFQQLSDQPALQIPSTWQAKKYAHRVILHPFSSNQRKNWSLDKFTQLAEKLKQNGWEPVFSLAPSEASRLSSNITKTYAAPLFDNLLELAKFYYESAAFIGNDSGNGHLASAMGLPTMTLFNRWKPNYSFRPAWGLSATKAPFLPESLVKQHWSAFLSVESVYSMFERLNEP